MARPVPAEGQVHRFGACLLGLAIGDALGAPYEFQGPLGRPVAAEYRRGVFGTAPGAPTDDSTLAGLLADSIIEVGAFSPADYLRRAIGWMESGPPDIGNQTRKALRWWKGELAQRRYAGSTPWSHDPDAGGNGALMALAPLGLLYAGRPELAADAGEEFCRLTHPNDVAVIACRQVAAAISAAAAGLPWADYRLPVPAGWVAHGREMGWALGTAALAFRGARVAVSTAAAGHQPPGIVALETVIDYGGDTDTNACVAGAIIGAAGAMWPAWAVDGLEGADLWLRRAQALHGLHLGALTA